MEGSRAPAASDFLWARPGAAPPAWRHLPLGAPAQIRPPRHCGPLGPGWGAPGGLEERDSLCGEMAKRTGTQWEAKGRAKT